MNEKYQLAYENAKAAAVVTYGVLTHEELSIICGKYSLGEDEVRTLEEQLGREGIMVVTFEQKAELLADVAKEDKTVSESEADIEPTESARSRLLLTDEQITQKAEQLTADCRLSADALENRIMQLYRSIGQAVSNDYPDAHRDSAGVIAHSVASLMTVRCGSYMYRLIERIAFRVRKQFPAESLDRLVNVCRNNEEPDQGLRALIICILNEGFPKTFDSDKK